ncbi:SUMF1/EgtB/PvdO family nonheme iron enzyme [Dapis sp. BLCC M126]|uniref:bifunctional serine/threonine-protein kinase/formylglycine-generating enzyme family protein n=1 Tax=Dapis sp. BLCC M126 TaxID=3400189 RepID=UPI003CF2EA90
MSQCLNPDCLKPNPPQTTFCQSCGKKLVLAERYRPLKIIGQGGFGRTFQAVDEYKPSKPFCVIKQFFPQAQGTQTLSKAAELFAQEAEGLDGLGRHPQIPELLAYFTQENLQYIVQEFINGQNLQQELEDSGAFDKSQILELLKSLLPVLEFIHSKQVIHRDIKPENIIRRKNDNQLVLVDFGAAKYATMTALRRTGTVIGSAGYVAPEQSVGKATFASDIYSLGVTCIHLLTEVEPFNLFDVTENDWVWRDYLPSSMSDEVGKILDKMIVGATKKRFENVGEILSLIQPTSQRKKRSTSSPKTSQPSTAESEKGELFTFEVLTFDNSSYLTNRTQGSARQKIEDLGSGIKLEMVHIPGGSFLMGSPENEEGRHETESPQHQVTLQPFYMSKYPITQEQYQVIMGKNPSRFKGKKLFRKDSEGGKRPVENVKWLDATEFCQKLSIKTGKAYILPSESQWEYACRAGTTTPFYFGSSITPSLVNYNSKSTCDVGSFPPNPFGLYDMHGNVWEWCQDIWHDNYNGAPTNGSPWENPEKGFFKSVFSGGRVLRGGGWYYDSWNSRSARRINADIFGDVRGFRIVSSVSAVSASRP